MEINHDDGYGYDEDRLHHQRCGACDKTFVYETTINLFYNAKKAECLNGADHKYERTKTFPPEYARLRCDMCGDEKEIKNECV